VAVTGARVRPALKVRRALRSSAAADGLSLPASCSLGLHTPRWTHFDPLTGARRFVMLARRLSPDESSASDHGHSTAWGTDAVQRRVHRAHGSRRQQRALQLMVSRKRGSGKEHADMRPAGGEAPRPPRRAHAVAP